MGAARITHLLAALSSQTEFFRSDYIQQETCGPALPLLELWMATELRRTLGRVEDERITGEKRAFDLLLRRSTFVRPKQERSNGRKYVEGVDAFLGETKTLVQMIVQVCPDKRHDYNDAPDECAKGTGLVLPLYAAISSCVNASPSSQAPAPGRIPRPRS